MGLRGVGAKHITAQASPLGRFKLPKRKRKGESDTAFLIRWIESLPVTSGSLAGSKMRLLPFQKDIIRGVLRVGVRQAIVSMPRKGGENGACGRALHRLPLRPASRIQWRDIQRGR